MVPLRRVRAFLHGAGTETSCVRTAPRGPVHSAVCRGAEIASLFAAANGERKEDSE